MSYKLTLLMVLTGSFILGIIYIHIIPPWQSPDEPTHLEYVKVLAEGSPPWNPKPRPDLQEEIIASLDRHNFWHHVGEDRPAPLPTLFRETPFLFSAPTQIGKNPPLYYFLASLPLRLSPPQSVEGDLCRLRVFSLIFTILTIGVVWACAAEIFGKSSLICPAAAAVTALLPQFMVIGTSVSPDPAVNLLGAITIYLILRLQKRGFTFTWGLIFTICYGIGFLVNYKFLILLPILPGIAIIHISLHRHRIASLKKLLLRSAVILSFLLLAYCGLVWYFPEIAKLFVIRLNIFYLTLSSYLREHPHLPEHHWQWFNSELFKSFWLKYGWLRYELSSPFYLALKVAVLGSLVGICLFMGKGIIGLIYPSRRKLEAILTLVLYAGFVLGVYYLFWGLKGSNTTTQARHLFLVIPAWTILFIFGWTQLFPGVWQKKVSFGVIIAFTLLNAISIFHIISTYGLT